MERADFLALLPLLITLGTALVVMLGIAIRRSHLLTATLTMLGLAAAFGSLPFVRTRMPRQITPLLIVDWYALLFIGLIIVTAASVALLCYKYFERRETRPQELYLLILLAALGCQVLAASSHFVSFFLGLEILSVSLYTMIGYLKERRKPLESSIKYLILAAASAAFLLFGMALIYADSGTMEFSQIRNMQGADWDPILAIAGTTLILTGVGFKLALVPFHWWTPDVYEGAPAPVTAFVATVSKVAVFALLLRYYDAASDGGTVFAVLGVIAVASMLAGNLLALRQTNVKRILAYSSIGHLGYILVALLSGGSTGKEAVVFYLVAYSITTLGAFAIVTIFSHAERDADHIEDYRGLFWQRPWMAGIFTAMLLSLAGIPVTAGFLAKFYVIWAGVASGRWFLLMTLAVSSTIGLFYYLRIVAVMYSPAPLLNLVPTRGLSLAESLSLADLPWPSFGWDSTLFRLWKRFGDRFRNGTGTVSIR